MLRMRAYLLCLPLMAVPALSRAEDSPGWTICTGQPSAELTDDRIVTACTAVLDAAQLPPGQLADAVFRRGLAQGRLGHADKQDADFTAAQRFDPKFTKVFLARGYDDVTNGNYAAAIKQFDQAIAIDAKLAEAYFGRGLAYDADRQFDRAIKDHQQAISLNPKYAMAYFGLGLAYHDKGQNERAIEAYSKAIELDPRYAQALYDRGVAYGALNQIDRAIADFSAAIDVQPNYAKALFMRGLAYRDSGKADAALADFEGAVRADPKFEPAIKARDELEQKLAFATPEASGQDEQTIFALYLARAGNVACGFGIDEEEKAALEREVASRMDKAHASADRAKQLEMRAEAIVAKRSKTDAKFCAPDGEFAGQAREMFDAVADRPKRSP